MVCTPLRNVDLSACDRDLLSDLPFQQLQDDSFRDLFDINSNKPSSELLRSASVQDRISNLLFNPFTLNSDYLNLRVNDGNDPDINFYELQSQLLDTCDYYLEEQFNEQTSQYSNENFSLFHLNVRSLNKNFDNLLNHLSMLNTQFSVISLSETWNKDDDDDEEFENEKKNDSSDSFEIKGYEFEQNCRKERQGGGVAMYIKTGVPYKILENLEFSEAESLFIEIKPKVGKATIVGVVYRPPDSNLKKCVDEFDQILSKINSEGKFGWICGDFNINLLNYAHNSLTADFTNSLFSYLFYPVISKPTRITSRSATLIDNIFTNCLNTNMKSGILVTDISDHFCVFSLSNFKLQNQKSL